MCFVARCVSIAGVLVVLLRATIDCIQGVLTCAMSSQRCVRSLLSALAELSCRLHQLKGL